MDNCNHPVLTAYIHIYTHAEPPYSEIRLDCEECGAVIDYDDRPVGAIIRDEYGRRLDNLERQP